jgi:hypothetical protein
MNEPGPAAPPTGGTQVKPGPPHLSDPRAITILTTEHWSLLTARSLVYNETFSRGAMFLTFLSASLVALGFVAGSGAAGSMLPLVAIPILGLDLFVGLATLGRLIDATNEEFVALQGMARLRHAYLEMAPDLAPYFSTASHDDMTAVLQAYGPPTTGEQGTLGSVAHGLTTMPGMVMVVDSAIVGAVAGALAVAVGAGAPGALAVGVLAGILGGVLFAATSIRVFSGVDRKFEARFPSPAAAPDQSGLRNT